MAPAAAAPNWEVCWPSWSPVQEGGGGRLFFRRANAVQSLSVALHFRDAAYTINRRAACTPRVGLQDRGSTACCGDTPALSSSSSFSRLYGEGLELS